MTPTQSLRSIAPVLLAAAVLHLAVLLLGLTPQLSPRLWGGNAWAFLASPRVALVVALAVAFGIVILRAPGFPRRPITRIGLAMGGLPLFLLFRDETHLLGDGRLWISVLGGARVYHAHEPLAFAAARVVTMGIPAGDAAAVAGRLELFSVALGLAALVLLLCLAGELAATNRGRWFGFGLMASAGALQFGAGYVEAYPVLWVALLLVAWSAIRVTRGAAKPFELAAAAGLAAGTHGMAVLLLPAVGWLLWKQDASPRDRGLAVPALLVPLVVAYGLLPYILPSARQMSEGVTSTAGGVLQILRGLSLYPYGPAAWALDQLNRWTLTAPLVVPLLVGGWLVVMPGASAAPAEAAARSGKSKKAGLPVIAASPDRNVILFFLLAGLPLVLPGLILDTESARGAAVDWDAFGVAVVPLTILAAALCAPRLDAEPGAARPAALAVVAGLLGTLAFMAVNAEPATAVARFDALARNTFRTPRARAWGFEALAGYRRDSGDLPGALEAYERALDAMPKHPRLLSNTATLYSRGNRHAEAAELFRRVTEADPTDYNGWFYWGVESEIVQKFADAERGYRGALQRNPKAPDALLGLARVRLRSPAGAAEARELLTRSLEIAPNQPHAAEIRRTLDGLVRRESPGGP